MDISTTTSHPGDKEMVELIAASESFFQPKKLRKGQKVYIPISQDQFAGPFRLMDTETGLVECPETGNQFYYLGRLSCQK